MRCLLCAAFLALAGCNPIAYVPSPIPTAPPSAGLRASGGLNLLAAQGTASVEVAPVEGVGLYARGLYASTFGELDAANEYVHRGAEVGGVAAVPLSATTSLEAGGFVGWDAVRATNGSADIGCCSYSYRPVGLDVRRVGGHVGLWVGREDSHGVRRRVGPALRVVRASVFRERQEEGVGVFVEPALRLLLASPRADLLVQVGVSIEVGDDYSRLGHVPVLAGGTVSVPLTRLW